MRATPWLATLIGLMLILAACSNPAASTAPSAAASQPASEAPASASPSAPAEAFKVGYISLGESIPFVKLVSDNIKAEAEKANVEIAFCDSEIDAAKALACAQNLKVQEVQAVLNFQQNLSSNYEDYPTQFLLVSGWAVAGLALVLGFALAYTRWDPETVRLDDPRADVGVDLPRGEGGSA